jgi:hypothetical protein
MDESLESGEVERPAAARRAVVAQTAATRPTTGFAAGEVVPLARMGRYDTLDYWATKGILTPSLEAATGFGGQRRHSFGDVVAARVAMSLRAQVLRPHGRSSADPRSGGQVLERCRRRQPSRRKGNGNHSWNWPCAICLEIPSLPLGRYDQRLRRGISPETSLRSKKSR